MNLFPLKYGVSFLFLMMISLIPAQTIEEEVAQKSCVCIQLKLNESQQISQKEIKNCISKSGDEVLKTKDPRKVNRIKKNMQESVERLKIVYQLVEKCLPKSDFK